MLARLALLATVIAAAAYGAMAFFDLIERAVGAFHN